MLTIIMGKTCSGKNAVVEALKKKKYKSIVTYTSRPKRKGEREGKEYHFISKEDFASKIKEGFFAEWKSYVVDSGDEWFYGSPLIELYDASKDKDNNYVIILTPDGVRDVKSKLDGDYTVIYLYANRKTILNRLKKRKDKNDTIERRMAADDADFADAQFLANKIVYNNESDKLADVVDKVMQHGGKVVTELRSNK